MVRCAICSKPGSRLCSPEHRAELADRVRRKMREQDERHRALLRAIRDSRHEDDLNRERLP